MIAEEVPSLTVATILGVTVVILIAIIVVFVLGVLIDWRQQRLMDKRIGEVKRMKTHRKKNTNADLDDVSIANNMEEPSISAAPAESLRNLP
ncbi:jg10005 [Pararge aegeria aegeria]|uniref:Jg10005 protein n=1 Tax=Pararge aegeria aegeria TaxID=348720 RepID=A0A8S4SED7_9NEOP|nr:jg10005 [Pararge aegeria aegeria]